MRHWFISTLSLFGRWFLDHQNAITKKADLILNAADNEEDDITTLRSMISDIINLDFIGLTMETIVETNPSSVSIATLCEDIRPVSLKLRSSYAQDMFASYSLKLREHGIDLTT